MSSSSSPSNGSNGSSAGSSVVVVAVIQAAPVYLNLEQSLARALDLIGEAARRRAQLVVFPELWLPGYPAWLDVCRDVSVAGHPPMKRLYARLQENSVLVPGRITEVLGEAARRHQLTLVMGVQERVGGGAGRGTLYNSVLTFGPDGALINHHRQLSPTFNEKLIWSAGDGTGLRLVDTPVGRIGSSICSEHWMPLVRQTLHLGGEEIHVALWPSVREMNQIACRHYAMEGRCFVIAAGGIMRMADLPSELELASGQDGQEYLLDGGSGVIGPDGQYVAGPTFGSEVILLARINLERIREESLALGDPGQLARPDLFHFQVRQEGISSSHEVVASKAVEHKPVEQEAAGHEVVEKRPENFHTPLYVHEVGGTDLEERAMLLPSGTDGTALRVISPSRPSSLQASRSPRMIQFETIEP